MSKVSLSLTNTIAVRSSLRLSLSSKQTGDQAVRSPRPNPKNNRLRSKFRSLLPHAPTWDVEMVVGLDHPQLSPSGQLPPSHEHIREIKYSLFRGKKDHRACLTRSKVSNLSHSAVPPASCFQFVTHEPQVCSPLVPRKGNQESVTVGARSFLLHKASVHHCLVENSSKLCLQQSVPMGRAWCKSGVQKGSCLCVETFGAKIRPPGRCALCDSRSSQGPTHRGLSRPCSGSRAVPLQVKGSHPSGQG